MRLALRLLVNPRGSRVVFENPDDRDAMIAAGWVRAADAALIRGAGVDLATFDAAPEPEGVPIVALTARMLRDKGIGEFVEAARILRREGVPARFILAGAPDPGNRAAIPEETLRAWAAEGAVEYLGFQADVPALLRQSAIVCLPSYREGLPKALLEALAAARPIVTTDVPGCRETVIPGVNGLLVPTRDPSALAAALGALLRDPARRKTMGAAGRRLAETEFSNARVVAETLRVYRDLGAE
jgi:glycosyltransferase involved in cell wall biosynthesis